jgi:hypothetical protein
MTGSTGGKEMESEKPGFLEHKWVTTKYVRKKPGFFGWVRNS